MKTLLRVLCAVAVVGAGAVFWQASRLSPDIEPGAAAPDVTLDALDGSGLAVASLRGRMVLLDFWNTT